MKNKIIKEFSKNFLELGHTGETAFLESLILAATILLISSSC